MCVHQPRGLHVTSCSQEKRPPRKYQGKQSSPHQRRWDSSRNVKKLRPPDFGKIDKITLSITVRKLQTILQNDDSINWMAGRIVDWGLNGEELRKLSNLLNRESEENHVTDEDCALSLLQNWRQKASLDLVSNKSASTSALWDIENIRHAFEAEGEGVFQRECMSSFLDWLQNCIEHAGNLPYLYWHLKRLRTVGDLRFPSLEYATARILRRHIHLHVGPTNSGKTHGALVALCKARTGIYAGPLRLLAHEVWDRINSGTVSPGVPARACNLVTGEEVQTVDERAGLMSCTVEMAKFDDTVDVAVIDEIQMIADTQRGWAWTSAVLGIPAQELHLCGESSVVPLIKKLAEACGDEVIVHEYQRLSPLSIGSPLNKDIKNVQKGDCVVAFSRNDIFNIKDRIEGQLDLKCAVAYGALPPETKAEQAKLFNDPTNDVDVMVASDAIGMGLNLKIKRVVFNALSKWNGTKDVYMSSSQIKQIAGRAGRFRTNSDGEEAGGLATTYDSADLDILKEALEAPLIQIDRAATKPSSEAIAAFSTILPLVKVSKKGAQSSTQYVQRSYQQLLKDISLLIRIDSSKYFANTLEQQLEIAPVVEAAVPQSTRLTIDERESFSNAPANTRDERLMALFANMIRAYAKGDLVPFEEVESGLEMLSSLHLVEEITRCFQDKEPIHVNEHDQGNTSTVPEDTTKPSSQLQTLDINLLMILESLHRGLSLYLWLSYRFPSAFCYSENVSALKSRTEIAIDACLQVIRENRRRRLALLGREDKQKKKHDITAHPKGQNRRSLRFPKHSQNYMHDKFNTATA